jgi:hypothetical protein
MKLLRLFSVGPVAAVAAALTLLAAAPVAAETAGRPVNVVLEDQFRNRHETQRLRGDVVVLVYAERHGAEAALELGRRLHLRFHPTADQAEASQWSRQPVVGLPNWPAGVRVPDVHVVPIACVPEVPKPLHPVARSRLKQESPHVSVWLDFEDSMRQTFGMTSGVPNVAVVDTHGRPQGVLSGKIDDLKFEELVRRVDLLRLQARPVVHTAVLPDGPAAGGVVPASGVREPAAGP